VRLTSGHTSAPIRLSRRTLGRSRGWFYVGGLSSLRPTALYRLALPPLPVFSSTDQAVLAGSRNAGTLFIGALRSIRRLRGLSLKSVIAVSHHIRGRDADVISDALVIGYDGGDRSSRGYSIGAALTRGGSVRVRSLVRSVADSDICRGDRP
jgi:hypothetical protein